MEIPIKINWKDAPTRFLYDDDENVKWQAVRDFRNGFNDDCAEQWDSDDEFWGRIVVANGNTPYCDDDCAGHRFPWDISSSRCDDKRLLLKHFNYQNEKWQIDTQTSFNGVINSELGQLLPIELVNFLIGFMYSPHEPPKCVITIDELTSWTCFGFGIAWACEEVYCHGCYVDAGNYVSWPVRSVTYENLKSHAKQDNNGKTPGPPTLSLSEGSMTQTPSAPEISDNNDNDISIEDA